MKMKQMDTVEIYFHFLRERHNIWERKYNSANQLSFLNSQQVLTSDPILSSYKFTNVFRVLDRSSQFLLSKVQYNAAWNEEDLIFRTLLYKNFNLPSTWIALLNELGEEPVVANFEMSKYALAFDRIAARQPIFSNAYIMTGHKMYGYDVKHWNHMGLFRSWFQQSNFVKEILSCRSLGDLYSCLQRQPYIGYFLAYQYATDLNYSPLFDFDENTWTFAGPGAQRGIEKVQKSGHKYGIPSGKNVKFEEVIMWFVEHQEYFFNIFGHNPVELFGRQLKAIDIQNGFCETDKYLRVYNPDVKIKGREQRVRIKNKYSPSTEGIQFIFLPKMFPLAPITDSNHMMYNPPLHNTREGDAYDSSRATWFEESGMKMTIHNPNEKERPAVEQTNFLGLI